MFNKFYIGLVGGGILFMFGVMFFTNKLEDILVAFGFLAVGFVVLSITFEHRQDHKTEGDKDDKITTLLAEALSKRIRGRKRYS